MLVRGIFPGQTFLFKMHTFIHLPRVDLNTGVETKIIFLPELKHNSVHVKSRKHNTVHFKSWSCLLEFKWQIFNITSIWYQNVETLCGITISYSGSLDRLNLIDSFQLVGFWSYWIGNLCFEVNAASCPSHCLPAIAAYRRQWQVRKLQIISFGGYCLYFCKEKKNWSTPYLLPIHTLAVHTCKAPGPAAYHHTINCMQLQGSASWTGEVPLLQCLYSVLLPPTAGGRAGLILQFQLKLFQAFCS